MAELLAQTLPGSSPQSIAFADPLKKIAHLVFPDIPRKWLYGPSKYRAQIIPNAYKGDDPLTVRQLLIDLGNDFGRRYQRDIWIRHFDRKFNSLIKKQVSAVIVTDCRFRDEFDHLSGLGFYQIRIFRDGGEQINNLSETSQNLISDSEFDFVIDNNGTKKDLRALVQEMSSHIRVR